MLLAGDIGGTKTTLAIFSSPRDLESPVIKKTFSSRKYDSLESLLKDFLSGIDDSVNSACFGVAGPVLNGRSVITNLSWMMDEIKLQRTFKLSSVRLINDLMATSMYVPSLNSNIDELTLYEGRSIPKGVIAVIAPGTGLGEAFLAWDGNRYRAYPSEGGHCDFAPRNPSQIELLRYLQAKIDHVSYERVCSGQGLREIYAFFHKFMDITEEHEQISQDMSEADDPAPVIVNAAMRQMHCELCVKTLNTFVEILGAEAGNLALKVLATSGIYLAGGIPVHLFPSIIEGKFMQEIWAKGRLSNLVSDIPVHVITNPNVALYGAAKYGFEVMGNNF